MAQLLTVSETDDRISVAEIARVERMLSMIDIRNRTLANVSKWLVIWSAIQDMALRYACATEDDRAEVSTAFEGLLRSIISCGNDLLDLARASEISEEQFVLYTDCTTENFYACVQFLFDTHSQWFSPACNSEEIRDFLLAAE